MARPITTLAALFAACVFSAATAQAQDCPRGDLDKMYCDSNGDMVADTPADPKQRVNPSVLVFAYTPVEDPAVYGKVWDGFIKHMEKLTGKKVVFFPVQSNAAEIEAMRSGRLHVAGFNTGSNPIAVNCAGFVPLAIMGGKNGEFGYEMEIIVPADSAIKSPADLKGKKIAFTEPTSNSGFKAPSAILKADFNLEKDRDYTAVFSGKHDNSVIGVANKDYEAAAIANEVMFRMFARNVVDKAKIRTIYKSDTFPTTGYGVAHNLDPALTEKIKEAFFTFPWEGSALKAEFKGQDRFVPITYKKDWNVIRKIDAANGVKYSCK
ncbi:phosphate/phosphite/phosphonate ABC transporter substrate-binding protein [Pseudolabrys sp. FHR47]|uniref:phosphate/phosphite/phosphonate ABC transporter substrate-binding protein n=1 Tax=Pseudolabrys sp. FHR47 TaxID=2562284 RepID=UPI0010BEA5AB|nr:phosphate/phosphite/phosphonate ABC transporter substrate-binding protein [Pseudolabrys sp. FHR47]